MRPPKLLFFSHSASRNGATILLLQLLQWLRRNQEFEFEVSILGRGDLTADFEQIAPTRTLRSGAILSSLLPKKASKLIQRMLLRASWQKSTFGRDFDLVYFNTSALWQHLSFFSGQGVKTFLHVHELEYALKLLVPPSGRLAFQKAERVVGCSQAVAQNLIDNIQLSPEKVDTVHSFIAPISLSLTARRENRRKIRERLRIPENALVVGGCGTLGWRKGTDLFLQVARHVKQAEKAPAPVYFLWVGGSNSGSEKFEFDYDAERFGFGDRCIHVSSTGNVHDYYCAMDVFALTSREDPFPLVMLEAGALEVPTVCFKGSGGGPEFVESGAGISVPYLDVGMFAEKIRLLQNQDVRLEFGKVAATSVRRDYSIDVQAPKLMQSLAVALAWKPADGRQQVSTLSAAAKTWGTG